MKNSEPEYWVEADKAVKDCSRVIGYSVWHYRRDADGTPVERQCVRHFRVRKGDWSVALHLANLLRDDLNS